MRSAINITDTGRDCRQRGAKHLAGTMLLQTVGHLVFTLLARCHWLLPIATFLRQHLAQRRLHQRLALCRLTAPFLRHFSAQEIKEIDLALDALGLIGVHATVDTWRQLRAPCVNGARKGFDAICTLMRHGIVRADQFGPDGDALLHAVVRSGLAALSRRSCGQRRDVTVEERIHLLVSLGARPDQANVFGDMPLQLAWERGGELGNRAAVALLAAGCNPMQRDRFGMTMLHRAARSNNLAVVRGWCETGLLTNPTGGLRDGRALLQTPLMFAVMAGHRRCVDVLIDKERRAIALGEKYLIDGRRLIDSGRLPSEHAAQQSAAGEHLIAQGQALIAGARASLDFADSIGATALHWAIDYGRSELAELLVVCGADRSKRAGRVAELSWTCTQLAAARARLKPVRPILLLLLEYGVYPDQPAQAVDQTGWRRACEQGLLR